jgi:RNA polymerase sigma-70 factor (ECF subfamily)
LSEPSTFGELYAAYAPYMLASLRRLGVSERDIEDVAHDAFVAVHRHFAEWDRSRPLKPWLFAFAVRTASDYRRRFGRTRELLTAEGALPEPPPSSPEVRADIEIDRERERDLVLQCLDTLDESKRALLILHDIDEVPIPEVARALSLPTSTAYSRLRLAREAFEKALHALRKRTSQRPAAMGHEHLPRREA